MQVRPFDETELRFELDMCIGCHRCMQACPVPLSEQVAIADLNHALLSDDVPPQHIVRFTDACVLCGSCVPVCPVDDHRDRLMMTLKRRIGTPWDEPPLTAALEETLPIGWDLDFLVKCLRRQRLFRDQQHVSRNYLLHFCTASALYTLPAGEVIMREGEFGRETYFILSGSCELTTCDIEGEPLPIAVLQAGDYIGEQGMLTGQPRNDTLRVVEPAVVLEVPEQAIRKLLEVAPALESFFVQNNTPLAAEEILARLELLQDIAPKDLHWLAQNSHITYYDRGQQLFATPSSAQGDAPDEYLHILLDGFVKVARRTARSDQPVRVIAYRQRGDYFAGGMDMFGPQCPVTVTAINRVTVAEITRDQLKTLLRTYPAFRQRLREQLLRYRKANEAANSGVFAPLDKRASSSGGSLESSTFVNVLSEPEARADLHALVDDGVVEGTDVLLIDLDRCIHCNECVEACERRHGHSRMNRSGLVVGNISVVNACRQCQDPVCMLCSRAGIARAPSGEVYITESCIGCGICAERCPYDNISIVSLEDNVTPNVSPTAAGPTRATPGFTSARGRKMLPVLQRTLQPGPLEDSEPVEQDDPISVIRKKLAVKCDLCMGYNDQACVQACPTGAAIRVDPVTFFGSTEEILRQRTR